MRRTTKIPRIDDYNQYIPMIKRKVYQFSRITDLDREELEAEANWVFCNACKNYKPEMQAKFTSYLWASIQHEFVELMRKDKKLQNIPHVSLEETTSIPTEGDLERETAFRETLDALSQEAQEVVKLILSAPAEMLSMSPRQDTSAWFKITRGLVERFLVKGHGWEWKKTWQVTEEIKSALASLNRF